ncbi:Peptidyl-prolyl cis-trans isomerase-like 1 [Neophaeococcomyces mojaviensis]|uniref:Peptidyl-prolyl cis-trans isomerase-like 1 n=1 Tax=Neophaeococcomyces mojaviensis TaxID=3383035 RepID=A0ACC3A5E0_9EURO|nr:Peptidyl-prolyl cis-trans isomerase-like 1 [Knufia sp. JES_112]
MGTPLPPVPMPGEGEPIVFLDVTLGGESLGRIKIHLFSRTLPKTAENFRQFCTGEYKSPQNGKPLGYKGCKFHRVVKSFILQSGDFLHTSTPSLLGTGNTSIYNSRPFSDESFLYTHSKPGLLSMANSGPNTNGCQFFITCAPAPHLDGKHVVFGQVIDDGESMQTVRKIENVRTAGADGRGVGEKPVQDVRISQCGEM